MPTAQHPEPTLLSVALAIERLGGELAGYQRLMGERLEHTNDNVEQVKDELRDVKVRLGELERDEQERKVAKRIVATVASVLGLAGGSAAGALVTVILGG